MRVINKSEHEAEILDIFNDLINTRKFLILWQLIDDKRAITPIYVSKVDEENFSVMAAKEDDFSLEEKVVYFFCKQSNLIFKSELKEYFGKNAQLILPDEMKLLDQVDHEPLGDLIDVFNEEKFYVEGEGRANQFYEDTMVAGGGEANIEREEYIKGRGSTDNLTDKQVHKTGVDKIDKYRSDATKTEKISTKWAVKSMSAADTALFEEELSYITLEEEDKKYEGMRAAPRAKPPEGKMVTVQEVSGERAQGTYVLYDLSRGGLSFLVFNKDEFNKDEQINILAFDTKKFDEPMVAKVMSVREADQMGVQYKVGCMFATED